VAAERKFDDKIFQDFSKAHGNQIKWSVLFALMTK
jgi:hypothetical protein